MTHNRINRKGFGKELNLPKKEKMLKRFTALSLSLLMMLGVFFSAAFSVEAATYDVSKLVLLMRKFPDGKYWNHVGSSKNNPDGYTSTPCTHHFKNGKSNCSLTEGGCECNFYYGSIQCAGYAYKTANELVGTNFTKWEKRKTLDVSKLCVGDIIRYMGNTHSITVVGVSGNTIAYTGANWGANCLIKWSSMDASEVTGLTYVLHDPNNTSKNSNVTFFNEKSNVTLPSGTELWQVGQEGSLNVRNAASTSSGKVVGSIPINDLFYVTTKKFDGTYLWGKVEYGSVKGWSALNYASYLSGSNQSLKIEKTETQATHEPFSVRWNAIGGADSYTLSVYSDKNVLLQRHYTTSNSAEIVLAKQGTYKLSVSAASSKASSWKISSAVLSLLAIDVESPEPKKIVLEKEKEELFVGDTAKITAYLLPSDAKAGFAFSSSDKGVATVDSSGTVNAIGCGSAVIRCSSAVDSSVYAECKVEVSLAAPESFKQTSGSSSGTKLSWNSVNGAQGYLIYRKTNDGKWKKLAQTTSLSFSDSKLSGGSGYTYAVKAFAENSGKTFYSSISTASCITAPTKASTPKVSKINETSFTLSWSKSNGATSYVVYRYNDSKKAYEKYKSVKTNSLVIKSAAGAYKKYAVAAVKKGSFVSLEGAKSSAVYGFSKPGTVKLSATGKSKSAVLSWKSVKGATRYEIFVLSGKSYKLLATVSSSKLTYTAKNLKSGKSYTFKVRACTKHGTTQSCGVCSKISVKAK